MNKALIICLMGPTATGKTELAIRLAEVFPLEIISVDSAMVYRGMDIGTAKPSKAILEKIPHYLIDICEPSEIYSAGKFCKDALEKIEEILQRGHIPFLIGGTMLYFRALQKGLAELPPQNPVIRKKINQDAAQHGWMFLYEKLKQLDPVSANKIHPNDKQRIQRALEIIEITKLPLSYYHAQHQQQHQEKNHLEKYHVINLGLMPQDNPDARQILKDRIAKRFDIMLEHGLIEEVKKLISSPLPQCLKAVGYTQVIEYLTHPSDHENLRKKAVTATQQLAKRQITWLRSWGSGITYFDSESESILKDLVDFLQTYIAIR